MGSLSDYDNTDMMLGGENSNSCGRELAIAINGSISHDYTEAFSHPKGNSSLENEIRNINNGNEIRMHDRLLESWKASRMK